MANPKSAWKRVRITTRKNLRNRMIKSSFKTALKRFDMAVHAGDSAKAQATFTSAVSSVDKAALKGVIHKNNANRKKAQLARKLNSIAK